MRTLKLHHDGHGLNESIVLTADEKDPLAGGASHHYRAHLQGEFVLSIQFQHGPRNEPGSKPGVTEAVLLAILIDRMEAFNKGPYACRENAIVKTKLEEALHWMKARADERAQRGVLGKNEP